MLWSAAVVLTSFSLVSAGIGPGWQNDAPSIGPLNNNGTPAWGSPSPNHPSGSGKNTTIRVHDDSFVPDQILRITMQNISLACSHRLTAVVNGTTPGPPLRIPAGKTTWIRVYNDMPYDNLTMHWHGLTQSVAPFADGTPSASQWPMPPGHFFDYEVHPEVGASGSYFYHSHVGFQAASVTGALIVEDEPEAPYTYDAEHIVMLTDFFQSTDQTIEEGLIGKPFAWSGETDAVMVNGVGGPAGCEMFVIDVEPGKTYRWSFIGATALSMTQFALVGHRNATTTVGADARYTKPYPVDLVQDRPSVYHGYGILRYHNVSGATNNATTALTVPSTPPLALTNATYDWLEYALEPLYPNDFPAAEEVTRRPVIYPRQSEPGTIIWQLNGDEWNETSPPYPGDTPYLINIYKNGPSAIPNYTAALANQGWDPYSRAYAAKLGEVLEIVWQNTGSLAGNSGGLDYHPFHAHGAHYSDLGSGNGTYDPTLNELKLRSLNYTPVQRDTTNLYRYATSTTPGADAGWRAWRLRVQDAGVWMVHCHILQHMIMGMQSVWVMGDYEQVVRVPHFDAAGYLDFGGDAWGNQTWAPRAVHWFDE